LTTPLGTDGLPPIAPVSRDRTNDLIIVVPGIMGSCLQQRDGRTLWGLKDLRWYGRAWFRSGGLDDLALTPAELDLLAADRYDPDTARVQPAGLLEFPAWMPFLGGVEPYTELTSRLRTVAAADHAVVEFPYDWRLPVTLNSILLARTIDRHLAAWRGSAPERAAARLHGGREPKAIIVAHSMGGLVAQGLSLVDGGTRHVRSVITMGTPFYGSVKAAALLAAGTGAPVPMPRKRLRNLVASLPGVYDLLPTYQCRLTAHTGPDTVGDDLVRLTASDVAAFGGEHDLAQASFDRLDRLHADGTLPDHHAIVGTSQPTAQSLRLGNGTIESYDHYVLREQGELVRDEFGRTVAHDRGGDGTVFRGAAVPHGYARPFTVTQQHGALATTRDTLGLLTGILTHRGTDGVYLGAGDIGLHTPDSATPGEPFTIRVVGDGSPVDPAGVTCDVVDAETDRRVLRLRLTAARDGRPGLTTDVVLPGPGLFRVRAKTGGADPVTRLMSCAETTD
jgi:hypothetical protein